MQDHRKLRVWHLAHELAQEVIATLPPRLARAVPGLRAQAIRAAISVPANLVEGCGRGSRAEFLHFVQVAIASLNELEEYLDLARGAGMLRSDAHATLEHKLVQTRKLSIGLARTLSQRLAQQLPADSQPR
ncbi:MAG TPA: four helix bundle protein [Gemmatimonadaceae bacterium]|nr:four helix bundle protein [Gemmatimonadaceae bacterium]